MNYNALNFDETTFLLHACMVSLKNRNGLSAPQIQFYEKSITRLKEKLKNMRKGEAEDPRNDQDYDTFQYGTEPIPGDCIWVKTGYSE